MLAGPLLVLLLLFILLLVLFLILVLILLLLCFAADLRRDALAAQRSTYELAQQAEWPIRCAHSHTPLQRIDTFLQRNRSILQRNCNETRIRAISGRAAPPFWRAEVDFAFPLDCTDRAAHQDARPPGLLSMIIVHCYISYVSYSRLAVRRGRPVCPAESSPNRRQLQFDEIERESTGKAFARLVMIISRFCLSRFRVTRG